MIRRFKFFLLKIAIASAFLVIAGLILFLYFVPGLYLPVLPWMVAFFALVTLVTFGYQLWLTKRNMGQFTRHSMLISLFRLFIYSFFAIIYLASNQENLAVFVVCLVLVYVVFTFLEVAELARISKEPAS